MQVAGYSATHEVPLLATHVQNCPLASAKIPDHQTCHLTEHEIDY